MAMSQTRRSISINGDIYWQLRKLCDAEGIPMSKVTQQLIECFLVVVTDSKRVGDDELVLSAKETARKFSLTTPAESAKKEPIRGGGTHLL